MLNILVFLSQNQDFAAGLAVFILFLAVTIGRIIRKDSTYFF